LIGGSVTPDPAIIPLATPPLATDNDARTTAYAFLHNTEAYSKILWRNGFLLCPNNCLLNQQHNQNKDYRKAYGQSENEEEEKEERCRCQCTVESKRNLSASTIFDKLKISQSLTYYINPSGATSSSTSSYTAATSRINNRKMHSNDKSVTDKSDPPPQLLLQQQQEQQQQQQVSIGLTNEDLVDSVTGRLKKTVRDLTKDETARMYDEILYVLCNPGYLGDMFQVRVEATDTLTD
jgi:hypothetical protein